MAAADHPGTEGLTAKGRATRERILQSAAQVLLSEGLSGFNLDKVRRTAAVSGSQLTHYFADKPALLRAILDRQIDVVLDFHRHPRLGGLATFDDFERWADLNVRYLRQVGYIKTPTYHTLAGQLAKSDDATRRTLADGYRRWVDLLEGSLTRMRDRGVLRTSADPQSLALAIVAGHQGAGVMAFAYQREWPLIDTSRFLTNYLRTLAADPAERNMRKPHRPRDRQISDRDVADAELPFTQKGLETRSLIVRRAAELMFEHGVNGTSLDDVRKALNVSGSQLSHYFDDKRDLIRQVIAFRADDVIDFHTQPSLQRLESLRALGLWAEACKTDAESVYVRGGCVYGSLTGELLESDEGILDDLAHGYDRWLKLFCDGFKAMRRRGEVIDGADPRHLAVAMVAAHQGGSMLAHATGRSEPFCAAVDCAVDYAASFRGTAGKRKSKSIS